MSRTTTAAQTPLTRAGALSGVDLDRQDAQDMGNPSGRNAMKVVSITPAAEELILLRVDAERYRLLKALSAETRVRIADIVQHASTNG